MTETSIWIAIAAISGFAFGSFRPSWVRKGLNRYIDTRANEKLKELLLGREIQFKLERIESQVKAAQTRESAAKAKKDARPLNKPNQITQRPITAIKRAVVSNNETSNSKRNSKQPKNKVPYISGVINRAGLIMKDLKKPRKVVKREQVEQVKQNVSPPSPPTPPIDRAFEHIFYGTQLTVGQFRVVSGLSKGMHRLEVIQNQLYVDNKLYPANVGDLERIKALAREGHLANGTA